jgi:hypothetical protein
MTVDACTLNGMALLYSLSGGVFHAICTPLRKFAQHLLEQRGCCANCSGQWPLIVIVRAVDHYILRVLTCVWLTKMCRQSSSEIATRCTGICHNASSRGIDTSAPLRLMSAMTLCWRARDKHTPHQCRMVLVLAKFVQLYCVSVS